MRRSAVIYAQPRGPQDRAPELVPDLAQPRSSRSEHDGKPVGAAELEMLAAAAAVEGVDLVLITDRQQIDRVRDEAGLGAVDRRLLWGRRILNPFALQDAPASLSALVE